MKFAFTDAKRNTWISAATVSFFFNARGDTLEKTATGMLRSIILQVLEKLTDLQDVLDDTLPLSQHTRDSSTWKFEVLQQLFASIVSRLNRRRVICFIDALDECHEDEVRAMVEFFETLGDEAIQTGNRLYICLSSRHYPYINIRHGKKLVLEDQPDHGKDLERYVRGRLRAGSGPLIENIRSQILVKADGVFMWAVLVVDILNKEFQRGRIFAVEARLKQIPSKLSELFRDMLRRDTDNMAEFLLCIQWVLYAKRPLKREEFYFAVVSGISPANLAEWNPDYVSLDDMERFVLSSSKGLAEVTRSKSKTIQFIHESVRDFLIKDNGLCDLWHELGEGLESLSHDQLKQCCFTYFNIDKSAYLPSSNSSTSMTLPKASSEEAKAMRDLVSEKFPFLEYAIHQVFYHANEAAARLQQSTFLEQFPLQTWIELDNLFEKHQIRRHTPTATFLYLFAEKNWTRLVTTQLDRDPQIDFHGERYRYPLFAAIANGHRNAVKAILQHNMSSSIGDDVSLEIDYGRDFVVPKVQTPLLWAIKSGYEGIAKLLLDIGSVDVEAKDTNGHTSLQCAVLRGNEGIVKLLLDTGRVNLDVKDDGGYTLLAWAAIKGYEGIVKLFLDTGRFDVDAKDSVGYTPFWRAAINRHEGIVKLLLDTGMVDVDAKRSDGETVLFWAARNGHEDIVRLLLDTGRADVDVKDSDGYTLLSWAAMNGHWGTVKILLKTGRVGIDAKDPWGGTALSHAARNGHEGIVKMLLDASSVGRLETS